MDIQRMDLIDLRDTSMFAAAAERDRTAIGLQGRDLEHQRVLIELYESQEELRQDFLKAGFIVNSVWNLLNFEDIPKTFPILVSHLRLGYHSFILEGIGRALATLAAYPYFEEILRTYLAIDAKEKSAANQGLAWAVVNSSKDKKLRKLMEVAEIPAPGEGRLIIVNHLKGYVRYPEIWDWFQRFEADPSLALVMIPWVEKQRVKFKEGKLKLNGKPLPGEKVLAMQQGPSQSV